MFSIAKARYLALVASLGLASCGGGSGGGSAPAPATSSPPASAPAPANSPSASAQLTLSALSASSGVSVPAGEPLRFPVVVTNAGTGAATNVGVGDLSPQLALIDNGCGGAGLAPNASCTL